MHVAFGECEFDSGRRVLLRHGGTRPLSPKAFDLLQLLLDRRPEVVTKHEILDRLWPDTFVSEASVHNLIAEIRGALADPPRSSRYVRTVPRVGYAFHGDARAVTVSDSALGACGPRLVSKRGEWILSEGPNFMGRDPDCVVRIDSTTVSRRHARILLVRGEATADDLGSKNGTQVNGHRLSGTVALRDGDLIQVGSVTMTYRAPHPIPSTRTWRRR